VIHRDGAIVTFRRTLKILTPVSDYYYFPLSLGCNTQYLSVRRCVSARVQKKIKEDDINFYFHYKEICNG
jgi:hypothetical protein